MGARSSAQWAAALACAVLVVYLAAIGWRGVLLVRAGGLIPVLLGLALIVLPLVGLWAAVREWRFGVATAGLARELEARGQLPVDDLPRTPGGRIERSAADAWFVTLRGEVETAPQSWVAWFRLACGYDAAGDRRRARAAMRRAVDLHGSARPQHAG